MVAHRQPAVRPLERRGRRLAPDAERRVQVRPLRQPIVVVAAACVGERAAARRAARAKARRRKIPREAGHPGGRPNAPTAPACSYLPLPPTASPPTPPSQPGAAAGRAVCARLGARSDRRASARNFRFCTMCRFRLGCDLMMPWAVLYQRPGAAVTFNVGFTLATEEARGRGAGANRCWVLLVTVVR